MNDEGHDDFEVAIERELHGALDEAEATRLAAHLAGCASCQDYRRTAMEMEKNMDAIADEFEKGVQWGQLKATVDDRIGDLRTRLRIAPFIIIGMLSLIVFLQPGGLPPAALALDLAVCALVLVRLWQRLRAFETAAGEAESGEALFEVLEAQHRRNVNRLWRGSGVLALVGVYAVRSFVRDPSTLHAAILGILFMGVVELARAVLRLRRERALLRRA
jgi:hypothetical protein